MKILKKPSYLLLVVIAILNLNEVKMQCPFDTCMNNGTLNPRTCRCNCFVTYSGDRCENLHCEKNDPMECASFASYCKTDSTLLIPTYCPHTCGKCPNCQEALNCKNSGLFDRNTCKCQCETFL